MAEGSMTMIETGSGPVVGFEDTHPLSERSNASKYLQDQSGTEISVKKWLGIPYAQAQRWRRPSPPEPWCAPLECYEFGPHFPQPFDMINQIYAGKPGWIDRSFIPQSEKDGFNLNVFAPHQSKEGDKLPVLVWIHGGGFSNGGSGYSLYDPTEWIRQQSSEARKFIVVTGNYRLNLFGFLASFDLLEEDPEGLAGNYGVYDCIAYLEWVRNNIAKFGGDPENITAFGESAGAAIIGELLTCKKPLFRRAILQSGFPGTMRLKSLEECDLDYQDLLLKTSVEGQTPIEKLAKLREIPESKIVSLLAEFKEGLVGLSVEQSESSEFLKYQVPTLERLRQGYWNPYVESVIMGVCKDEGSVVAYLFKTETQAGYNLMCEKLLKGIKPEVLSQLYPQKNQEGEKDSDSIVDYRQCPGSREMHDFFFEIRLNSMIDVITQAKNYETKKEIGLYTYQLNASIDDIDAGRNLGSVHSLDVVFIFNIKSAWLNQPENSETSSVMGKAWYEFAKSGCPDHTWPEYSISAPFRRVFEQDGSCSVEDLTVKIEEDNKKIEFWKNHDLL